MYAVDFPAKYGPDKQWNSCVRRRLWMRYRRYIAENNWSCIECLYLNNKIEPFIDITVGGHEISGMPEGYHMVWAVTISGHVSYHIGYLMSG